MGEVALEAGEEGERRADLIPFFDCTYNLTVAEPKAALLTKISTPCTPAQALTTLLNFNTDSCSPWSRRTALVFLCNC